MRLSVIDIGSNTFLLLIGESDLSNFYVDTERFVGLGEGLANGSCFTLSSLKKAEEVLEEYKGISFSHGAHTILPFGTEAVRRASNREELFGISREVLGIEPEILTGDREAFLSHVSCYLDVPEDERVVSVDVGGGSTEVVCGTMRKIDFIRSFPVGSVILTRKFIKSDPPGAEELESLALEIKEILGKRPFSLDGSKVVFFGGTAATLSMLDLGVKDYDPFLLNMHAMDVDVVDSVLERLSTTTKSGRIGLGVSPGRADFIVAGIVIIREVARWLGAKEIFYSVRGVRYGYFMEKAERL